MKKRQKPGITKNDCLVASLTAAIVICSVCFISFLNYQKTWASIIQGYQNQSIRIYHCLDDYIFVDMFTAINTPEDMQKQIYLEVQDKLKTIRDAMGIRYLYTAKVADNGQYIYVVDGLSREAGDFAAPGTPIEQEIIPNMNKALQGEQVLPDKMLDTQWGKIANAYFPIHENRADSKVIGVIGIEFDMEEQAAALDGIKTSAVETTVILTILAVLLSVPLYRRITRIYQKASRAKSDFLSNMSHEMRTPLNAISGMTYIGLQAVQDEEKVRDCLVKIQSSTAYMTMLINDVLDMARIESGKILLREEAFHLPKLADELLTLLQAGVAAKEQVYSLICDIPCPWVKGDELRLKQVLVNIIGNAMKYTPKGGKIGVTIQQIAMDETYTKVYFQVEDTGIGITPEALKHIFTAFERDKWARDNQIQGTGLGLAIAKELVEKMGGCMKVDSVLGKGSCFFFTISFEKARELSPGVEKMPEPNHKATAGARILLAEDNDLNREIARALLDMQGYLVEEAINGEQALELFQSRPAGYYQAILMDIKMPIMDGYEATERIRHVSKEGAGIPIIAMTANAFDEDVKQAKEVGMSAYLAKPIDPDLLACTLEQWILKWREELMLGGLL